MSVAAPYVASGPSGSIRPKAIAALALDPGLSRFAFVLLLYVMGLAALATLSPFDFDFQHPHGYLWDTTRSDVALNLAFLFPVGFLLRLARAERAWPWALDALGLGMLLSLMLELCQLFLPTRVTSPTDVLTNGAGAWVGGIAHARIGPYLDRRLQRQLSLHLPLANLLYLCVPLLTLDGLATCRWDACLPLLPLGGFISLIAAGMYKHRLEGTAAPFPNVFACSVGLLFGIGYMPIVTRSFDLWASTVLLMAALTRASIVLGTRLPATERRFVQFTIQRAAPWFFFYIVVLGAHPVLFEWLDVDLGMEDSGIGDGQVAALGLLRDVCAFTLLGYLGSELQARSMEPTSRILGRVLVLAIPAAVLFGGLKSHDASFSLFVKIGLLSVGVVAGVVIHRMQLRLVHSWSRTTQRPPS